MTNRKKRLKRGVESLEKQILLHGEKERVAEEEGRIELVEYYGKELMKLRRVKGTKEKLLKHTTNCSS